VQVNGHTDNVGNSESNQALSKKRADAVKAWLMANAGSAMPADRIRVRGYGDSEPVGDNATADGKAQNRRVDVLMLTTN
jgi:OOP family OmpA-OmpF porin